MIRTSFLTLVFSMVAAPAFAHEGAGIVHYLTHADHVAGLIAMIAVPLLFWTVLRRHPTPKKRPVRKD